MSGSDTPVTPPDIDDPYGGLVLPEVQMVKPGQLVDLAGLVEASQLLALASAEVSALEPDEPVTLVVVPRG